MNIAPFKFMEIALAIGGALGAVFSVIYVNTVEYWKDIKRYGKEEADKIRKRW